MKSQKVILDSEEIKPLHEKYGYDVRLVETQRSVTNGDTRDVGW